MVFVVGQLSIDIANKLIPNILSLAAQLGSTLVLFLVFRKYLYSPMVDYIERRNQAEQDKLSDAKEALQNAKELEEKRQLQFRDASNRVADMIETGRQEASRVKEQIIAEGQKEIAYKRDRAEAEIEHEVRMVREQIRQEMVSVAMLASQKLMKDKFDPLIDKKRIEEYVSEATQ